MGSGRDVWPGHIQVKWVGSRRLFGGEGGLRGLRGVEESISPALWSLSVLLVSTYTLLLYLTHYLRMMAGSCTVCHCIGRLFLIVGRPQFPAMSMATPNVTTYGKSTQTRPRTRSHPNSLPYCTVLCSSQPTLPSHPMPSHPRPSSLSLTLSQPWHPPIPQPCATIHATKAKSKAKAGVRVART